MSKDNVVEINKPETFIEDPLSEILRQGARSLLAQALEVEIQTVLNQYKDFLPHSLRTTVFFHKSISIILVYRLDFI
jgi:hypothetical protein